MARGRNDEYVERIMKLALKWKQTQSVARAAHARQELKNAVEEILDAMDES